MQVNGMDKRLIDINNIRGLTTVKVWDLVLNSSPNLLVVPAMMIIYDGGKVLNLCAKDDYFNEFVRKVVEVYNDEKDNILEDSLTDPFKLASKIDIDSKTKEFLINGGVTQKDRIYSFYEGKESYQGSLFYQVDEVRSLLPIIKYHIESFFNWTKENVIIHDEFLGYRDNYMLFASVNGIEKPVPLIYEKISDTEYRICVGTLLDKNRYLDLKIDLYKDRLVVIVSTDDGVLYKTSEYRITNGVVKQIDDMVKNGITINYENKDLVKSDSVLENLASCDCDINVEWFRLPWGDNVGIETTVTDVSETERIIEIYSVWLAENGIDFAKREYYSKVYKRNKTATVDGVETILSEYQKKVIGLKKDGYYLIETSLQNGEEYYYHGMLDSNGLKDISRDRMISLTKKDNINYGSDLLNKYKLCKVLEVK